MADLERLVAQFDADISKYEKAMTKMGVAFEKQAAAITRQNDAMARRLEASWDRVSRSGAAAAKRLTGVLAAGLSFAAIERFVSKISESVDQIKRQSAALGISTDTYQAWTISAEQAEVGQDELNTALDKFSKNIGEAQLHATPFGKLMQKLGVDIRAGTEPALYQFIDAINKVGPVSQRNAVLVAGMGKGAVTMAGFLSQGSEAIKRQAAEWQKSGSIIQKDGIEKIDALGDAWRGVKKQLTVAGANVLVGFADSFDKFAKDMGSQNFQTALKQFGSTMAQVVAILPTIARYLPAITGAFLGARVGGIYGAVVGGVLGQAGAGMAAGQTLEQKKKELANFENTLRETRSQYAAQQVFRLRQEIWALTHQPAGGPKATPTADTTSGGGTDLGGALNPVKPSQYAKAVADLITKTKELSAAEDESTEATVRAQAASRLLEAANSDGLKVTPQLRKQIDDLSTAYGHLAAMRAFDKDLAVEDSRIEKLKAEAEQAALTKAALAELEERQQLIEDFHHEFGKNAVPNATQQQAIDTRAKSFGVASGASEFAKTLANADEENASLEQQIQTVGLYGAALAEAQMRLSLLNEALKTNDTITAEDLAKIDALARAHGDLTARLEAEQREEQKRVELADQLRTGLENVGIAATHGFKSAGDAAKQFMIQLLEMIMRLYVLQPLIESLLGKKGESGGGILGTILNSLGSVGAGHAGGGLIRGPGSGTSDSILTPSSNGEFMVNAGATARNLPLLEAINSGRALSLPSLRTASPTITVQNNFSIDARYATEGTADMIDKRMRAIGPAISDATMRRVRAEFPDTLRRNMRDRF